MFFFFILLNSYRQGWHGLSDAALEEQIARGLLFRRFIGFSISEAAPDHSTIGRFRNLLHTEKLPDPLLLLKAWSTLLMRLL